MLLSSFDNQLHKVQIQATQMGSTHSIESQSEAIFQQLQRDYIVEDHFNSQSDPCIKSLFDRKTAKKYLLRMVSTHSVEEASALRSQLHLRQKFNCESVIPVHTYFSQSVKQSSSSKEVFYLLFNLSNSISLHSQIAKRSYQSKLFKEEELIEGIQSLAKVLAWLKHQSSKKRLSEMPMGHRNINAQTVFYSSNQNLGRFILSDPLMWQNSQRKTLQKYPSPEELMRRRQVEVKQFDPFASDLFSAAMTMLQAATLGRMQRMYLNNIINYETLKVNLKRCPYEKVRKILSDILLGDIRFRKSYLERWISQDDLVSSRKIKIVSSEKNCAKSRGRSQQKINLVKNKSTSHISASKLTNVQMITSHTYLHDGSANCNVAQQYNKHKIQQPEYSIFKSPSKVQLVNFIYSNKQKRHQLFKSSFQFRSCLDEAFPQQKQKQPFTSSEIHDYISRVQQRLSQLQKDVKCVLKERTNLPSGVNSVFAQPKRDHLSKSMYLARTQKSEDISVCEYTINIKSVEQSKIELLEPQQLDQSLRQSIFHESLLGRDNDKETEKSKASDSDFIYEASYIINQSKISSGNASNSRDSFEIREDGIDDSASYIINMKGTQLEVLSNLVIPQEESSQEQSVEGSFQAKPKGEFIEETYENGGSYKGYAIDGKRHGTGTFVYAEGGKYEGNWKNNRMHGFGKLYYTEEQLAFEGFWFEDAFHGRGKLYNDEALQAPSSLNVENYGEIDKYWVAYEGDFAHDCKEGYGKLTFTNGWEYCGQFHKDLPHGKGCIRNQNKQVHGVWDQGVLVKRL